MRVVFLPVRGTIHEAMDDSSSFNSLKECMLSVVHECGPTSISCLSLSFYCFDSRFLIDCYALCTTCFGGEVYSSPAIVGYVYFGLTKSCMKKRLFNYFNKE